MKNGREVLIDQLRQQRKKLAREKNWSGVLVILNRLIEIDPDSKRFCAKAEMLKKWGCILEAKENYEEALMINPHSQKAHKGLSETALKLGDIEKLFPQEVQKNYRELIYCEDVAHLRSKIIKCILQKKWDMAAELCKKLSDIESTPLRFCMEAVMLLQSKKWKEAIVSYDKALQKNPQFEVARLGIAKIKDTLKREKEYKLKVINIGSEEEQEGQQEQDENASQKMLDDSMYLGVSDDVKNKGDSSEEIGL